MGTAFPSTSLWCFWVRDLDQHGVRVGAQKGLSQSNLCLIDLFYSLKYLYKSDCISRDCPPG